jgi:hypothetical protein
MSRAPMVLFIFAFLLAGPATAQLVNENLLVVAPPGYKTGFQTRKNNMDMTEWVPAAETVENWTEMVTIQVFHGQKIPPDQFRDGMAKMWTAACPNAQSASIASTVENGYQVVVWLLTCPNNPKTGKPENTWFKVVQGNDSFYVVQKAFKFTPSKDQVVQWTNYLKQVQVCDTRAPDHPCPQLTPVKPGTTP